MMFLSVFCEFSSVFCEFSSVLLYFLYARFAIAMAKMNPQRYRNILYEMPFSAKIKKRRKENYIYIYTHTHAHARFRKLLRQPLQFSFQVTYFSLNYNYYNYIIIKYNNTCQKSVLYLNQPSTNISQTPSLILKSGVDLGSDADFAMYSSLLNNDNEKSYLRD